MWTVGLTVETKVPFEFYLFIYFFPAKGVHGLQYLVIELEWPVEAYLPGRTMHVMIYIIFTSARIPLFFSGRIYHISPKSTV